MARIILKGCKLLVLCLPSDFQARRPCTSGTLCPLPTLDGRLGTKVIACSKLRSTPWMIQAGSLFALRGLGRAQKKELCNPFKPIFISSPTGFSSPTSGALHSEGKIHFPARWWCRSNQVAAKAATTEETMAQSGVILTPYHFGCWSAPFTDSVHYFCCTFASMCCIVFVFCSGVLCSVEEARCDHV